MVNDADEPEAVVVKEGNEPDEAVANEEAVANAEVDANDEAEARENERDEDSLSGHRSRQGRPAASGPRRDCSVLLMRESMARAGSVRCLTISTRLGDWKPKAQSKRS